MTKRTRLQKLCYRPAYAVAIRRRGDDSIPYQVKYPSWNAWYADPFICTDKGKEYVFVEYMNAYHLDGEIAVASVENGQIGTFRVIIHEPFHMSFPNVFQWKGYWYMLPETNMAEEVRLYRSETFPYHWELDTIFVHGVRLVDHALYPIPQGFLVVSHDITNPRDKHNRVFRLDMDRKSMEEVFPEGNWCRERPGGTFYQEAGKWYHCIQDDERAYGDYLHIYEVEELTEKAFFEREIGTICVGDVPLVPDNGRMEHLHTYNCNTNYEVIDVQYDKLYPDKFFSHQWREILKRVKGRK